MKEPPMVLNLADLPTKRKLMQHISMLTGLYEVTIKPRKRVRSLNQNSYYWVGYVTPFCHWLRDAYGDDSITIDEAHELLKRRLLKPRETVNKVTGEVMKLAASSATLDTKEFSDYLERAAEFLASFAGIVVLPADAYFEKK